MEGEPYYDRDFPSNSESLITPDDSVSEKDRAEFGKIVWRRARDIPELSRELFSESESNSEIKMGLFKAHDLYAVLSSINEAPCKPKDFFIISEIQMVGIILVKFFVNGQPTYVTIDDSLPCIDGELASMKCADGSVWVSLLEKAWAKLNGSYASISNSTPSLLYTHLFGLPANDIDHKADFIKASKT